MTKQERFDRNYLRLAFMNAYGLSKDPSTKVGALIVGADNKSVSIGYNGFVAGAPETYELWNNRADKYPRVIHAEINAILNCPFSRQGATIYCSLFPCYECLGFIINAGITTVVHYGPKWERDPHPIITKEREAQVTIRGYSFDPVIDHLIAMQSDGVFPDLTVQRVGV